MKKHISIIIGLVFIIYGCDRAAPGLEIHNSSWPDGTCISIIDGNSRVTRTTLYGIRTQLPIPKTKTYRIRVASPGYITFISDTVTVRDETATYPLPNPVPRKKIGSWRLGLAFSKDLPDSLYDHMLLNAHGSLTTVSPELLNNEHIPEIVRQAHKKSIDVTASVILDSVTLADILALADSAEVYCADGIVLEAVGSVFIEDGFADAMRELAAVLHERGMTFAVKVTADCSSGELSIPPVLHDIFTKAPVPERPDELRISFACDGIPSSVSAGSIEEKIRGLVKEHIPLSRISIELTLTAFKFSVTDDGGLKPTGLEPGEVQSLLMVSGMQGVVRLRDGSLRLGYRGALYVFDDCEGTAQKISLLRAGNFSRSAGIHIVYDGIGVKPGPEKFRIIAKSAGAE